MESNSVAKAFWLPQTTHRIRNLKMVGDGDSSPIQQTVSNGSYVDKIECANHAVKSYRSQFEQLTADNSQ